MNPNTSRLSRRDVLRTTAGVGAAAVLAQLGTNFAHAAASDRIRVGLIGCGGRGIGAAKDTVASAPNVQIVALGDVFQYRIDNARKHLGELPSEQYDVAQDRIFVGFDAYQHVIASGVDMVILTAPPGFRPQHIDAAVEAGKHIFAEKPVAVDPVGARRVMAAAKRIAEKKLGFVAGTQRRHQAEYVEAMKRIHDGAIGEIVSGNCYWNQGGLWMHPREAGWSDMEWQLRNWLYFTWLSGDHIVEQHVHQIDVMNWVFKGPPVSAYGMGGRQARTDPAYGHIYDHFAVEYEYPGGARVLSMCRQIDGTDRRVAEHIVGTRGTADPKGRVTPFTGRRWRFDKESNDVSAYVQEHTDLINSIRAGQPLNEAQQIAESTLAAIMGRLSAYTGKLVTWEQVMESQLDLTPPSPLEMGPIAVPPVPIPGREPLV